MFLGARHECAQRGLKGQCVLVSTDLKTIQKVFPRSSREEYLISPALKRLLSDKSAVCKQAIWPTAFNKALQKLKEINPFYRDVIINNQLQEVSKESNPVLWDLLTDENTVENDCSTEADSEENIEANDALKEKKKRKNQVPLPTVMHNVDVSNISENEVANIAPGEGQLIVPFALE